MSIKYSILKLLIGVVSIGYFFYQSTRMLFSHGIIWKSFVTALILFIIVMKWVPFIKKEENMWAFLIGLFATIPVNIRMASEIMYNIFDYLNPISKFIYGCIAYLCFLAVEEIIIGIITRLIWNNQKESI